MITDLQTQSVLERYHSDKHFSEFFYLKLQDGGKDHLA